jgi:hypothetical protein
MCNLDSITTNQAAITALFRVVNRYHTAPHGLQQQSEPKRRQRPGDPGRRADESKPIGVVFCARW